MQEVWQPIDGWSRYMVSNMGRVLNTERDRLKIPNVNQQGIASVLLTQDYAQTRRSVAVLVANAFLDECDLTHFDTPINCDGDRTNNDVRNLMWRPRWFAVKFHQQFKRDIVIPRPIQDADTLEIYENSRHVAVIHGVTEVDVARSCIESYENDREYRIFPTRQSLRFEMI